SALLWPGRTFVLHRSKRPISSKAVRRLAGRKPPKQSEGFRAPGFAVTISCRKIIFLHRGRSDHGDDRPQIAQVYADLAFGFWSFLRHSTFALRHFRSSGYPVISGSHTLRIEKKGSKQLEHTVSCVETRSALALAATLTVLPSTSESLSCVPAFLIKSSEYFMASSSVCAG